MPSPRSLSRPAPRTTWLHIDGYSSRDARLKVKRCIASIEALSVPNTEKRS
jgi:hypothetical protein